MAFQNSLAFRVSPGSSFKSRSRRSPGDTPQRPNVFSFDDLAIQRGLRMLYHHRRIDRKLFEKYRRRFSPCCSVASLYLWAIAGGALPEMRDYAPKKSAK